MAEVEITQEEVSGIDVNQVASMQLKDGTVVVVQGEGEVADYQNEGEFTQEELAQDEYGEVYAEDQSNQLRARPMMVVGVPRTMHPKPMVVPVGRPIVKPPVLHPPRGPVRPGVPVVYPFRARPGMPGQRPLAPKPVVRPGMPLPGPVVRPPAVPVKPVPFVKPGLPVKPVVAPVRPVVPGKKPLVNQMIQAPGFFRARPGETEEDYDFQEEEYGEDENYNYDDQAQDTENQLRAKPLVYPVGAPRLVPGMKPRVVPAPVAPMPVVAPKPKPVMVVPGPKRGPVRPVVARPNTFQPGFFRTRPGARLLHPMNPLRPMGPPMVPPRGVRPLVPAPKRYAYGFGPVLRSRPRSASYDPQENADENEYQYTEGCESSVCTKCGKEF